MMPSLQISSIFSGLSAALHQGYIILLPHCILHTPEAHRAPVFHVIQKTYTKPTTQKLRTGWRRLPLKSEFKPATSPSQTQCCNRGPQISILSRGLYIKPTILTLERRWRRCDHLSTDSNQPLDPKVPTRQGTTIFHVMQMAVH